MVGIKKKPKLPFQTRGTEITEPPKISLEEMAAQTETPEQKQSRATLEREGFATTTPKIDFLSNIPKEETPSLPPVKKEPFVINQETGQVSGIRRPDGEITFLPPEDIIARERKNLAAKQATELAMQENLAVNERNIKEQRGAIIDKIIAQIGQDVPPTAGGLTDFEGRTGTDVLLNTGGLLGAVGGAGGGLLAGNLLAGAGAAGGAGVAGVGAAAATGAAAGSVLPVVGTIVGATIATAGFLLTRVALSRRNVVKRASNVFLESKKSNIDMLNIANRQLMSPQQIVDTYNQNYANIIAARNELREQSKTKTGKSLSGAQEELADIEIYLVTEQSRRNALRMALLNPDANIQYQYETQNNQITE